MFDIGFWELVVTGVVGLLVLGPERLPGAVRTGSLWLGRLRRSFMEIQRDIEREIGADELKRELHNQRIMETLRDTGSQTIEELKQAHRDIDQHTRLELPYDISDSLKPSAAPDPSTPDSPNPSTRPPRDDE